MSLQLRGTEGIQFNDGSDQSTAATPYGRKNLIINGDMRIAQRGTSAVGVTSTGYLLDRMRHTISVGTWTISQDTDVPTGQGISNSLKYQCTTTGTLTTGSVVQLQHRFEGQNLQHLKKGTSNAESITLSFWVKSNKTGTYVAELVDNDNSRMISKTYTISTADTWEKKTITYDGDTTGAFDNDNNHSLRFVMWFAASTDFTSGTSQTSWGSVVTANEAYGLTVNLADSTSNYINITGLQLEIGDAASDFEFMPYDMELARCQRYFEKSYDIDVAIGTNTTIGSVHSSQASNTFGDVVYSGFFKTEKRDNPSMTFYQNDGTLGVWQYQRSGASATSTVYAYQVGTSKWNIYMPVGANFVPAWIYGQYIAESEL